MTGPTVAVIVPAGGRDEHLRRLLAGLARQTQAPDEIVIADMADATPVLRTSPVPVAHRRLRSADGSLPLAAARNQGAAATTADVLVFLDVDCLPHPELVRDYAGGLASAPAALACGQVRYLRAGWDEHRSLDAQSDLHPARPVVATPTLDGDRPDLFWSLNFATRATTWRAVGGFDEGYTGYGAEDTDLGRRAFALGIPLLWLPRALAYHQWHPPTRLDPARAGEIVANARRFHQRWGTWPMTGWLRELADDGRVRFDPDDDLLELVTRPQGGGTPGGR